VILPFEHIRVFRRKGVIKPIFIREHLGILDTLIEVFKEHKGKKRGALNEAVSDCEHLGYDYKMVRGLASVLESRSVFQSKSVISPIEARREVFTRAAKSVVVSKEERQRVLKSVARRSGINFEELEDSLYADLDDEQYLVKFSAPSSDDLMRFYNYANMVSLLAYSLSIEITYRGSDDYIENLVNRIKDSAISGTNRIKVLLDLKPTRRLSQRALKLDEILQRVIIKPEWSIKADIKYPQRYKTYCVFELKNIGDGNLLGVDQSNVETVIGITSSEKKESKFVDIIVLEEVARRHGLTSAQVMEEVKMEDKKYIDMGGVLVSQSKNKEIASNLEKLKTVGDAQNYLKTIGVKDFMAVLESYGYQVEWSRPRKNSRIYRI
jgi:predicted nuclease of restriction endonuclease-like RecB superfamily